MGTAVATFADRPALSPRLQKIMEQESNLVEKMTTPSLSIKGKNFHISLNGEMQTLQKKDADGDMVPVTTFKVIVLAAAKERGRAFYEGEYDDSKVAMPFCWSDDSVTPSKAVKKPCAASCAACPNSVKGSKKQEGKDGKDAEGYACGQYQMLALVPASDPTFEPLRIKLPITSVFDGRSPQNDAEGKFAWKNYSDYLRANGIHHSAEVITKLMFDKKAYPKLLFMRDAWTPEATVEQLVDVIQSDKVKRLVGPSWTPNGVDGVKTAQISGPEDDDAANNAKDVTEDPAVAKAAAKKAAEFTAAQAAAAEAAEAAATAAAAKAAKKAALLAQMAALEAEEAGGAAPVVTASQVVADDDDEPALPGSAAAKPTPAAASAKAGATKVKATPAAATATVKTATATAEGAAPSGLGKLLGKWGDDD